MLGQGVPPPPPPAVKPCEAMGWWHSGRQGAPAWVCPRGNNSRGIWGRWLEPTCSDLPSPPGTEGHSEARPVWVQFSSGATALPCSPAAGISASWSRGRLLPPRHSRLEMGCLGSQEMGGIWSVQRVLTAVPLQVQPSPPGRHGRVLAHEAVQPAGLPEARPLHHHHRHDRGGRARVPQPL